MISIRGLRKDFGAMAAVDGLSLEIETGCVFGFLGRNGAGKTTTIRMMMGLTEPSAGTVLLGGHDIRTDAEAAKSITGYLPDHPYLYDKLTGTEMLGVVGGPAASSSGGRFQEEEWIGILVRLKGILVRMKRVFKELLGFWIGELGVQNLTRTDR